MRLPLLVLVLTAVISLSACSTLKPTPTITNAPKSPQELSQLYTELGTSALLRSDFSQAIADLRKACSLDSHNAVARNHLGLSYYGLRKSDLAKAEFEKAVELDKDYSDAYVNLGVLAFENGKKVEARAYYKKALQNLEYKYRHRALTNLAELSLAENKIDEARELLYQSLTANPDYCLSHFLLGTIYQRENNAERAAEQFKESVSKTCVSNPEGHYQLGLAYLKTRAYDKARHEFVYVIQEFPQTAQATKAGEYLRTIP